MIFYYLFYQSTPTHSLLPPIVFDSQGTATAILGSVANAKVLLKSLFRHSDNKAFLTDEKEGDATDAQRELSHGSDWCDHEKMQYKWHPLYSEGWTNGYCTNRKDCNSPGYGTELSCCKSAYSGQMSGYCISKLPSPPTTSPTKSGGLADFFYADYETTLFVGDVVGGLGSLEMQSPDICPL